MSDKESVFVRSVDTSLTSEELLLISSFILLRDLVAGMFCCKGKLEDRAVTSYIGIEVVSDITTSPRNKRSMWF